MTKGFDTVNTRGIYQIFVENILGVCVNDGNIDMHTHPPF
jgi:hypothetical protein